MRFCTGKYFLAALLFGLFATGVGCAKAPDDSQLSKQISSKLSQDSGLQGKSITVQTKGGVVTLSGSVDNDAQRAAASNYASATPGIKVVVNNLQIAAPAALAASQTTEAVPPAPPETKPQPDLLRHRKKSGPSVRDASRSDSPGPGSNSSEHADSEAAANQTATSQTKANQPAMTEVAASQAGDANPIAPETAPTPPPPPAPMMLTIQSGTNVVIRLVDAISSETAQAGETFRATLDSPLSSEWDIAIPAGYNVEGHVVDAKSAGKFAGQSELVLQLDRILVGDNSYSMQTDQYRREGKNRSTNTAEKVGAGAVLGAIIGGIAGGGKGAGIGAAAGGGAGGAVQAASKADPIKLPSETVLTFTLQSPLTLPQVDQNPESERRKLESRH
ncbi:MAG: BON domain-containing protein [Terriglobales bacterium]